MVPREKDQKTGPTFPLAVCRCRVHMMAFTAYPPGFGPYLRQPLIAVGSAGGSLEGAAHEGLAGRTIDAGGSGTSDHGVREFEGTLFDAAMSAAAGDAWARTSDVSDGDIPDRWWSTQGRKLTVASLLIGIAPDQYDELRVRIAHLLGVPVTDLVVNDVNGGRNACNYGDLGLVLFPQVHESDTGSGSGPSTRTSVTDHGCLTALVRPPGFVLALRLNGT